MRSHQIESWALSVIERVLAGKPNEDARVELKADWPTDTAKVARQLAGHANAARGENILWLIGVDQSTGVIGAAHADLAKWYPAVQACFLDLSPHVVDLVVPYNNHGVMALLFETDRAPYVIKNPSYGPTATNIEYEVPWRYNTTTKTARRSELLRLLSPLQLMPRVDVLEASFRLVRTKGENVSLMAVLEGELYVIPEGDRLVYPFYLCQATVSVGDSLVDVLLKRFQFKPPRQRRMLGFSTRASEPQPTSFTIAATDSEAIVDGPGLVWLSASAKLDNEDIPNTVTAEVNLLLQAAELDLPSHVRFSLERKSEKEGEVTWLFGR
jgi:hypothetical protein